MFVIYVFYRNYQCCCQRVCSSLRIFPGITELIFRSSVTHFTRHIFVWNKQMRKKKLCWNFFICFARSAKGIRDFCFHWTLVSLLTDSGPRGIWVSSGLHPLMANFANSIKPLAKFSCAFCTCGQSIYIFLHRPASKR